MAMNTWLQMLSDKEIADLRKKPSLINKINKPGKESCSTYYACSINYFLLGDAYPAASRKKPLSGFLGGFESVTCETLENGFFHLVPAALCAPIAKALEKIDLEKLKEEVGEADPEELAEEEVDDFEVLTDGGEEDAGATLAADVTSLLAFYRAAAKKKAGVVIYTS